MKPSQLLRGIRVEERSRVVALVEGHYRQPVARRPAVDLAFAAFERGTQVGGQRGAHQAEGPAGCAIGRLRRWRPSRCRPRRPPRPSRVTRSIGNSGVSHGTVTSHGVVQCISPASRPGQRARVFGQRVGVHRHARMPHRLRDDGLHSASPLPPAGAGAPARAAPVAGPRCSCRPLSTPPMRLPRPPASTRPVMSFLSIMECMMPALEGDGPARSRRSPCRWWWRHRACRVQRRCCCTGSTCSTKAVCRSAWPFLPSGRSRCTSTSARSSR